MTRDPVALKDYKNRSRGKAAPGWRWRITGRVKNADGNLVGYNVTADSAPGMYNRYLSWKSIKGLAPPKVAAAATEPGVTPEQGGVFQ